MDQSRTSLVLHRLFSNERQQQLYLPSGTWVFVKYLNGLQFLGFFCAFFGLTNCLLGLLDVVIIPSFYFDLTDHFPTRLTLGNAYGFPIYTGALTISSGAFALRTIINRKFSSLRLFFFSLLGILVSEAVYWGCFVAAVVGGLLSRGNTTSKTLHQLASYSFALNVKSRFRTNGFANFQEGNRFRRNPSSVNRPNRFISEAGGSHSNCTLDMRPVRVRFERRHRRFQLPRQVSYKPTSGYIIKTDKRVARYGVLVLYPLPQSRSVVTLFSPDDLT